MNNNLLFLLIPVLLVFVFLYLKKYESYKLLFKKYEILKNKYLPIINIDEDIKNKQIQIDTLNININDSEKTYLEIKEKVEILNNKLSLLEEEEDVQLHGFYKAKYDFESSDIYKQNLDKIRFAQRELIKNKIAAICNTEWTVGNSKAEGRKLTNNIIKLVLRAFNGECDAAVLKVKFNNIKTMEQRINKSFETLNKIVNGWNVVISDDYLQLKLQELYLYFEFQEKKQEEKEEQRQIREQMREEEKVRKEIEKAKLDAEKQETIYQNALENAKEELAHAQGEEIEKYNLKIEKLQQELEEARKNKERALSRAQLTKSGHVYIISNIGSFGEEVYKIGMTRRLEPMDRVKELGDASVPFSFDVHAMIYSDDAPSLESLLHNEFDTHRVNKVNKRKEFFKISLNNIEKTVKDNLGEFKLTKIAEAREFRESLLLESDNLEIENK